MLLAWEKIPPHWNNIKKQKASLTHCYLSENDGCHTTISVQFFSPLNLKFIFTENSLKQRISPFFHQRSSMYCRRVSEFCHSSSKRCQEEDFHSLPPQSESVLPPSHRCLSAVTQHTEEILEHHTLPYLSKKKYIIKFGNAFIKTYCYYNTNKILIPLTKIP